MCGKKNRDLEKAMRQSCEAQLEELNDDLMKKWKDENKRREQEWDEQHNAALVTLTSKLTDEKLVALDE